jgi:hypothetical protein
MSTEVGAGRGPLTDADRMELLSARAPWLGRDDWARGIMYDNPGISLDLWVPGLMGSIFLAIFIAFAWNPPWQMRDSGWPALFPLFILGPLGIGLTVRTVYLVMRWIEYGGSRLRLETVPIPVGGACRAELTLSKRIKAGQEVKFRLRCYLATVHEMRSLSANADERVSQDINYQVIWEDEETVISDCSGTLRVALAVPKDVPGTSEPNQKFWYSWKLKAEVPGGAASYRAEFDVPVYKVARTEAQVQDARSIAQARQSEEDAYQPSPTFRVRPGPAPEGGTEVIFPPLRSAAHAIGQSVFFLASLTLFVLVFRQLPILILLIWGLVNFLLCTWLIRIWWATERVVIGNGTVSFTSGLFRVKLDQVKAIHVIAGPITHQKSAIRILGTGWRHFDVGDGIADRRDAEWLAAQLSLAAGIQPAPAVRGSQRAEDMEMIQEFVKDFQGGKIDFGPLGNALIDAAAMQKKNE